MKKITIFLFIILYVFFVNNTYADNNAGLFFGATYNPINSDFLMGSIGATIVLEDLYLDNSDWITEFIYGYGVITYRYEAKNPFTVQGETTEFWSKGGIGEFRINFMYQYSIKDIVGLRIGLGTSLLWSNVFIGSKPGVMDDPLSPINMAINGIVGINILPHKKFPIVLTASPGFFFDPYGDGIGIVFCVPITVAINFMFL